MARKSVSMPKKSQIFNYWKDKCITENGDIEIEYGYDGCDKEKLKLTESIPVVYDWGEPHCWCCHRMIHAEDNPNYSDWLSNNLDAIWNCKETDLERCHIIADSLGGSSNPENLFLMCSECHRESPDTTDKREFFRWIYERRANPRSKCSWFYDAMDECQERYHIPLVSIPDEKDFTSHQGTVSKSSLKCGAVLRTRIEFIKKCIFFFAQNGMSVQDGCYALSKMRAEGYLKEEFINKIMSDGGNY